MLHDGLTQEMRDCVRHCVECHAACIETAVHCLGMGGEHAGPEHQKLLADCAQACITSADFILRMSNRHADYCRVCTELCAECADQCDRLASGDETMTRCAALCRQCERSCREMAAAAV